MTIKAISDLAPAWFTPDDQEEEETPARFKIQQLNGIQSAEVFAEFRKDGDTPRLTAHGIKTAIKYGLCDWEGIEGESGEVKFSLENLDVLPGQYHVLIASEILAKADMTEDEAKK